MSHRLIWISSFVAYLSLIAFLCPASSQTLTINNTAGSGDITDFVTGGGTPTTKAQIDSNGFFATGLTGVFQFKNFATSTADTGISRDSAGVLDFGNGVQGDTSGILNTTKVFAGSSGVFGWPSSTSPDTGISKIAAKVVGVGNGSPGDTSGTVRAAGFSHTSSILITSTAPTVSTGNCGGGAITVAANGTAAFTVTVGTGSSATTCTINLPTAANGWNCFAFDATHPVTGGGFYTKQTGGSQTTAILTGYAAGVTPMAWTAGDVLSVSCFAR